MALAIGQHLVEKTPPANYHQLAGRGQDTLTKKVTYFTPFWLPGQDMDFKNPWLNIFVCIFFLILGCLKAGKSVQTVIFHQFHFGWAHGKVYE